MILPICVISLYCNIKHLFAQRPFEEGGVWIFAPKNGRWRFEPQKFVETHFHESTNITPQRRLLMRIWWKSTQPLLSSRVKKKNRTAPRGRLGLQRMAPPKKPFWRDVSSVRSVRGCLPASCYITCVWSDRDYRQFAVLVGERRKMRCMTCDVSRSGALKTRDVIDCSCPICSSRRCSTAPKFHCCCTTSVDTRSTPSNNRCSASRYGHSRRR